jgi:lysophospholipase L1-like esterase
MAPNKVIPRNRLWLFRTIAVIGALGIGSGVGWIGWQICRVARPGARERAEQDFAADWETLSPKSRSLLELAGYGPTDRVVAEANFDGALVFSGKVMERDARRGYRFRPAQRNLWARPGPWPFQLPMPDTPAMRDALDRAGVAITSTEAINSLGCRGAEPDALDSYQSRVLVLGDSFAQGILVGDEETFSVRLEEELRQSTGRTTLVVNGGVIGYSTEQEYYTLEELAPRLRPHVAVLCFYANDVHRDHHAVYRSRLPVGDWSSAERWLERAAGYCRSNGIRFAVAAIPDRWQMTRRANRIHYQQRLEVITARLGIHLIDPDERFLARRTDPLWLARDDHFAPAGHALFAQVLADHLRRWVSASDDRK